MAIIYNEPNDVIEAANIKTGGNPCFSITDFLKFFPNFFDTVNDGFIIPPDVIDFYIQFAHESVSIKRWGHQWKYGMSLFLAHFFTLYLQSSFPENATTQEIVAAGQAKGIMSSKSVGDVSVSYDFGVATQGIENYGLFNTTSYGLQFANLAKLLGKGGMYVL